MRRAALSVAAVALILTAAPGARADPVVAAAGDIACGTSSTGLCAQQSTSAVLAQINPTVVLALGDDQYESGSLSDFQSYYGPSWGLFKAITRPAPGNHEYGTAGAAGYFDYFDGPGSATGPAGDRTKGYYSFDVGSWHLVALNSNCASIGGCTAGSPEETWLRSDLASHPASCTLAYMHHPRWSSDAGVGSQPQVAPLVQALYDYHADLMLAGHAHTYERFGPQNPSGGADVTAGLTEIIAGTGGKSEFAFSSTILPNSIVHADTLGVLQLTLHAASYDWRFVPAAGQTFTDSGSGVCHGRASGPAAATSAASAVTGTSATLNGRVTPNGQPTTFHFEYGRTTSYGSRTPELSAGSTTPAAVAQGITGLARWTVYHFRLFARWSTGQTARGYDFTFTTSG